MKVDIPPSHAFNDLFVNHRFFGNPKKMRTDGTFVRKANRLLRGLADDQLPVGVTRNRQHMIPPEQVVDRREALRAALERHCDQQAAVAK